MNLQRKFGLVLKELRLEKGLSQESLANQSDIDRTYISDIEKGERNISLKIIERLAETLQISLSELFKKRKLIIPKVFCFIEIWQLPSFIKIIFFHCY